MVKVGIWGCGIVGTATAHIFEQKCKNTVEVYKYDKYKESDSTPEEIVSDCDFIFLCLPTPMSVTGKVNLKFLDDALCVINDKRYMLNRNTKDFVVIIRSTAVSGSSDMFAKQYCKLNIATCPEFLTEINYLEDALNPRMIVIGTEMDAIFYSIKSLFSLAFENVPYYHLTRAEAEFVKYMSNAFLASQVMTANELYLIADATGLNYEKMSKLLSVDRRIGTHLRVPGPDGDLGMGGKCLVKDVSALISFAKEKGYESKVLEAIMELNNKVRRIHDWLEIPGAVDSNENFL